MKLVPEKKILYLKQLTVGRIFPLSMPLLIVLKMHLRKANLCAGFYCPQESIWYIFLFKYYTLHILK